MNLGFEQCSFISNCSVVNMAQHGFFDCEYISCCKSANNSGGAGYSNCDYISSCLADNCNNGFKDCNYISATNSQNNAVFDYNGVTFVSSSRSALGAGGWGGTNTNIDSPSGYSTNAP